MALLDKIFATGVYQRLLHGGRDYQKRSGRETSGNRGYLGINSNPSTVATPSISLAAGAYQGLQTTTISCADAGADIYYTTGGDLDTTNGTLYDGEITLPMGSTTLTAGARNLGMNYSALASSAYSITPGDIAITESLLPFCYLVGVSAESTGWAYRTVNTCYQSFTVTGNTGTIGTIRVESDPAVFEVSLSSGSGYGSYVTNEGLEFPFTVYVRCVREDAGDWESNIMVSAPYATTTLIPIEAHTGDGVATQAPIALRAQFIQYAYAWYHRVNLYVDLDMTDAPNTKFETYQNRTEYSPDIEYFAFNGNMHTISNWTYTIDGADIIDDQLLGGKYTSVTNVILEDVNLVLRAKDGSNVHAGFLAYHSHLNWMENIWINNGTITLDFQPDVNYDNNIGGVIAFADKDIFINVHADVQIVVTENVTDISTTYLGGFAGQAYLNLDDDEWEGRIENCSITGSITIPEDAGVPRCCGGLAGLLTGDVTNTYADFDIDIESELDCEVGALVGIVCGEGGCSYATTTTNCYASGSVPTGAAGFINSNPTSGDLTTTDCYFCEATTGSDWSEGTPTALATEEQFLEQLQSIGWDASSIMGT